MSGVASRRQTIKAAVLLAGAVAVSVFASPGARAAEPFKTTDEIVSYSGPDREERLIETAKQKGSLTLYSNAPASDNTALVDAFQKKYGIKVESWRAGSEEITQRIVMEARGNRFTADAVLNNGPGVEALHREELLVAVNSPYTANLYPAAIPAHHEWAGFCYNVLLAAYNTNLVSKEELPKSYEDLLDPKWKGRLGIEADDSDWFAGVVGELGGDKGVDLFRKIAATNQVSIRKGHSLLMNLVSAGEVPLALTVFIYTAEQAKKAGAPVDWFVIPPLVAMPNSIAVLKNAPNPAAAVLFFDFMLSEAQTSVLPALDYVVTDKNVPAPIDRDKISMINVDTILDQGDKWHDTYSAALTGKSQ